MTVKKVALLLLIIMLLSPNASYAENIVIKEGTEVLLKVLDKIKSGEAQKGQIVHFLVEKSVKDKNCFTLIEDDANAYGTINESESAGMMGSSGKLAVSVDKVEAFNGIDIPLRGSNQDEGTSSTGAVVAGVLLVSVFSVFFRGENAVIPAGTIIRAQVDKTTVISGDMEQDRPDYGFQGGTEVDQKLNEHLKKIEGQ